jgi:hypothetical protein
MDLELLHVEQQAQGFVGVGWGISHGSLRSDTFPTISENFI